MRRAGEGMPSPRLGEHAADLALRPGQQRVRLVLAELVAPVVGVLEGCSGAGAGLAERERAPESHRSRITRRCGPAGTAGRCRPPARSMSRRPRGGRIVNGP
jgi:hypothetical protein